MQKKGKARPKQPEKEKREKKQEKEEPKEEEEITQKKEEKHSFSLYDLLEVNKEASPDELKKQYRKLVLQYHPDKNKDPSARQKFQKLKEAYDILMDPEKRKQYDETGRIGDQFDEGTFEAAYNYYRTLYKKVTPEDIQSFGERYRFKEMEKQDLLAYYEEHSGDMTGLLECIPLSSNEDIPRFIKFFEEALASKTIAKYKAFDKTKGKVRLLKDETEQFEQEKLKDMGALVAAIQGRSNKQTDFLAELEAKYGGKKKADPKLRKKKE